MLLHLACKNGHSQVIEILIREGTSIEERNATGRKPIHEVAEQEHHGIVEILLDLGASVEEKDSASLGSPGRLERHPEEPV
jgi:ankyrin repeat protein